MEPRKAQTQRQDGSFDRIANKRGVVDHFLLGRGGNIRPCARRRFGLGLRAVELDRHAVAAKLTYANEASVALELAATDNRAKVQSGGDPELAVVLRSGDLYLSLFDNQLNRFVLVLEVTDPVSDGRHRSRCIVGLGQVVVHIHRQRNGRFGGLGGVIFCAELGGSVDLWESRFLAGKGTRLDIISKRVLHQGAVELFAKRRFQ